MSKYLKLNYQRSGIFSHEYRIFFLLIAYRWGSLIPAFWAFLKSGIFSQISNFDPAFIFSAVVVFTIIITVLYKPLTMLVLNNPLILGIDVIFSAALLVISFNNNSPFYLYSLSPLLAGAFFFGLKGGFISAALMTPLYIISRLFLGYLSSPSTISIVITELAGIWLIPLVIGYSSRLSDELLKAHKALEESKAKIQLQKNELEEAHTGLKSIYDLTTLLRAAPDVKSVQGQVLYAITHILGYRRSLIGLLKPESEFITSWYGYDRQILSENGKTDSLKSADLSKLLDLDLPKNNIIFNQVFDTGKPGWFTSGEIQESIPRISQWLMNQNNLVIPLIFHEHPVGVIFVTGDIHPETFLEESYTLLSMVANQAAISLGTTMLCVERAQELAVEHERNRIARDIHDTVSQSLFGVVLSLDACVQMLPNSPLEVKKELEELQILTNQTRDQVRHSIFDLWPSSLTFDVFKSDLNNYVGHCFRAKPFAIDYQITGLFDQLSPAIRRNLYRITQEALTNVLHHAEVDEAKVCLEITGDLVKLVVQDEGIGFNPALILAREHNRERFGLHGIQERVKNFGGICNINSKPGVGTIIRIEIPINKIE